MSRQRLVLLVAVTALVLVGVGGCSAVRYYAQAVGGHLGVMMAAEPVDRLLAADGAVTPQVRARLVRALQMREFASRELGLPDNGSYRSYADLKRPYVVWNVFAAPEFSVEPTQSCFLFAGCIAYRGFYGEADANAHAEDLRRDGLDVFVYGVTAYSTIGWFDDPLLNTFIQHADPELARILFHELAHQVAYTKDDSAFNESFAVAVEEEGLRRWLAKEGAADVQRNVDAARRRRHDFVALVQSYVDRLRALYAEPIGAEAMRAGKARLFAQMRVDYERMKREQWNGFAGYDRWFARELNNAHLASVSTYEDLVPAFRALIDEAGGDLPKFYARVKEIARLPKAERDALLRRVVR